MRFHLCCFVLYVGGVAVLLAEDGVAGGRVELLRNASEEQDGPGLVRRLWVHVLVHALQVSPELPAREALWLHVRRLLV